MNAINEVEGSVRLEIVILIIVVQCTTGLVTWTITVIIARMYVVLLSIREDNTHNNKKKCTAKHDFLRLGLQENALRVN